MRKRPKLVRSMLVRLPGCGYGVHIQELSQDEVDSYYAGGPQRPDPEKASQDEMSAWQGARLAFETEFAMRMVRRVTYDVVAETAQLNAFGEDFWESVSFQELALASSEGYFLNWMHAVDITTLRALFTKFHVITDGVLSAIMGKAVTVSPV